MKPNLFEISTKELSQDAFFTWLLQWADNQYESQNPALNKIAREFVRLLIKKDDYNVEKVEVRRQWRDIDILAKVNNELLIAIEDKKNASEHGNQLERYKSIIEGEYLKNGMTPVCVYIKTGNESLRRSKEIAGKGWIVLSRKDVLRILDSNSTQNDILSDFIAYLEGIEAQTNGFRKIGEIQSNWRAAEGFYIHAEELLSRDDVSWGYYSNRSGGFLGLHYFWVGAGKHELYIQIENPVNSVGIRLLIKMGKSPDIGAMRKTLSELYSHAEKYGIKITKPGKHRTGTTATLAEVVDAFPVDEEGNIKMDQFVHKLRLLEKVLESYTRDQIAEA